VWPAGVNFGVFSKHSGAATAVRRIGRSAGSGHRARPADGHAALNLASSHGTAKRHQKIRIVIFGVEATCTEIDDLVTGLVELLDQLLFPGEPIVIYISKCLAKEVQAGRSLNASSVIGRSLIGSPTVLYETGARLDPYQIFAHSR